MLLDISGNTFSSLGTPQDADAMAFLNAASITDSTQITAIDNLVFNLKQNNLWNKMYAIYPFVGGTSVNNHKYNLKDPRDLDAAYRLVFSGSWTYSNLGISSATPASNSNFVDTFFSPFSSSSVSQNSVHISSYIASPLDNITIIMGSSTANTVTANALQIIRATSHGVTVNGANVNDFMIIGGAAVSGHMIANRTSSTVANGWLNGIKAITNTTASITPPNFNIYLGARNAGGSGNGASNKQIRFASIGIGLTDTEASVFNTIVESYQTTLSRQVISSTTITINRPTLSNVPTVIYQPQQIFENKLTIWYDFNDQSNLFSDTGFTTTITNNQVIKGIRNKGTGNGRNYNLYTIGSISGTTSWRQNYINSNKNLTLVASGSPSGVYATVSALTISDSASAMTYSFVYRASTTSSAIYAISCSNTGFQQLIAFFVNTSTNTYQINLKAGGIFGNGPLATNTFTIPSSSFRKTGYNICTFTVDSASTLSFYHHDQLIGRVTTTGNTHPIGLTSNTLPMYFNYSIASGGGAVSTGGSEILEMILSDGVCLTQDKVIKLNQYYRVKYNLPHS